MTLDAEDRKWILLLCGKLLQMEASISLSTGTQRLADAFSLELIHPDTDKAMCEKIKELAN
jgi:hypothetical protein